MRVLTDDLENIHLPDELVGQPSLITIGAFDGIHLGHQRLIRRLVLAARRQNALAGLVTFYPHPAAILDPQHAPRYLTTPGAKNVLLEKLELDWTIILAFDRRLAATTPRAFMEALYRRVMMRQLYVSDDFALGRNRQGDISTLRVLGQELGFEVHVVAPLRDQETKIGSSHIRALLRRGHVQQAAALLGRPYTIAGPVVYGAQRGRCIGFPTANLSPTAERVMPANGVYVTRAYLGADSYESVTSIGTRPTFDNGQTSIETFILDFDQDIYGCDLVVEFIARLRPERKFGNIQELIAQITADVQSARLILDRR